MELLKEIAPQTARVATSPLVQSKPHDCAESRPAFGGKQATIRCPLLTQSGESAGRTAPSVLALADDVIE